jgi:ketosteroid isomerase-like protein
VSDLIAPPSATSPLEAVELVAIAVSDGDLEAAVAQYERGARLCPWAADVPAQAVADWLRELMNLRLPVAVSDCTVLRGNGVALVAAARQICGAGPDCQRVSLGGLGSTIVRRQRGGTWRIAADAWRLESSFGGRPR